MINRRHIRIKVLQSLYAFQQQNSADLNLAEKHLENSLNKIYELYLYILSLICEVQNHAEKRIEENKLKFLPTQEDLNPNLKFIENKVFIILNENVFLRNKIDELLLNFYDETPMIRKLYSTIRETEEYKMYMGSQEASFEEDRKLIREVVLNTISESEDVRTFFEEKNIFWNSDFDIAIMMADKTLKRIKENDRSSKPLPKFYQDYSEDKQSEYLIFGLQLFRKTIANNAYIEEQVSKIAKNWDIDRMAVMDSLIIKMAVVELLYMPTIPLKVTLNEAIDISKEYSTQKSQSFVNGVLDTLISEFLKQDLIKKEGRGLIL